MIKYYQELCQILNQVLIAKYNTAEIDNIIHYIYNSDYYKYNILDNQNNFRTELKSLSQDLLKSRPVQYCIGEACFMNLVLHVDERVLIPRPETEELVEWILKTNDDRPSIRILDIGTGSGAIGLALSKYRPEWNITLLDISSEALQVAQMNASKYKIRVNFLQLDFILDHDKIIEKWDILVSNPPYISHTDLHYLSDSVRLFEPNIALIARNDDPDIFYRVIAVYGKTHLNPGGKIYCEINEFRAENIFNIFNEQGYQSIKIKDDLQGKKRMIMVSN